MSSPVADELSKSRPEYESPRSCAYSLHTYVLFLDVALILASSQLSESRRQHVVQSRERFAALLLRLRVVRFEADSSASISGLHQQLKLGAKVMTTQAITI